MFDEGERRPTGNGHGVSGRVFRTLTLNALRLICQAPFSTPGLRPAGFRRLDRRGGQQLQSNLPKTGLAGTFGLRWFEGRVPPLALQELWAEQEHWNELLSPDGRARLRAMFSAFRGPA